MRRRAYASGLLGSREDEQRQDCGLASALCLPGESPPTWRSDGAGHAAASSNRPAPRPGRNRSRSLPRA
eukprot:2806298-Alexandrium_andersonii.AAC.1